MLMMMMIIYSWMKVLSVCHKSSERRVERKKCSMASYRSSAQAMAEPGIKLNCLESYISSFYDMKKWLWWGEKEKNRVRNPLLEIKIIRGLASYSAFSEGSHTTCQDGILGSEYHGFTAKSLQTAVTQHLQLLTGNHFQCDYCFGS